MKEYCFKGCFCSKEDIKFQQNFLRPWREKVAEGRMRGCQTGFTLIELLVVVLIIGILAAVAVPQYQKAVAKSRVSSMLALGKSIAQAQEVYYLNSGSYTKDVENLDIQLPSECSPLTEIEDEQHNWFSCGNDFVFDNDARGVIRINYCPAFNTEIILCEEKRDLQISFGLDHVPTNAELRGLYCKVSHNSNWGQKICSSMGTKTKYADAYKL